MTPELVEVITPDISTRLAKLKERTAAPIEPWEPKPNDTLVGVLIGSQRVSGVYGENDQILIKSEDGKVTSTWLTNWLKQNMIAKGAERGDLIALTFLGKKQSPTGNSYNAYSLIVDKGA
jgi:hypothetical protein